MAKLTHLISALLVMMTGSLSAYLHPYPGNWGVQGDFIYLLPSIDDTYFVINSPAASIAGPTGTREKNDFGFNPGFRVEGVYAFCGCNREIRVAYTRLRSRVTKAVAGDFLWAAVGAGLVTEEFFNYTGTASSKNDLLYQRVDAFFTQEVWNCCCSEIFLYGGIEYAHVRVREDFEFVDFTSDDDPSFALVNQKTRLSGVGPQFGAEFDYNICSIMRYCPGTLSVVGLASGTLLVSQSRIKQFNQIDGVTILDVNDEHTWRIVPVWHARVGVNYAACFGSCAASLEIGYEFNSYQRAVSWQGFPHTLTVPSEQTSVAITGYRNFDAHGLYINLGVTF